jgi:hypothetical protein
MLLLQSLKKSSWGVQRAQLKNPVVEQEKQPMIDNAPDTDTVNKQLVWQRLICNEVLEDGATKPRVMAAHAKSQTNKVVHPNPNVTEGISDAFNIGCDDLTKSKGKLNF